jgi:hypothetical protein
VGRLREFGDGKLLGSMKCQKMLDWDLVGTEDMAAQAQAYRNSGREGLCIENMVGGVFAGFGVECLEKGLCEIELTHRAGD